MRLTDGPVSIHDLTLAKQRGERFVMITAYDANMAALLDEVGVPVLLVGDSLGMVVLGHSTTLPVTLDEMIHHTAAVARGTQHALIVADLPFGSYQNGPVDAFDASTRLLKESGAHAVKLEGGRTMVETVGHLVDRGIPVMGHLGLTPQSVHQFGGFRVQGRDEASARRIVQDAVALADAGAFSIVLECIPADLADEVTAAVAVPTIGIGAGAGTDAQVLVWHDLLGLTTGHRPRFVKAYADLRSQICDAVRSFHAEVANGEFPGPEHRY
ncbi:MAG: 3-methyl-2-oxobutanoate hydroxymethyltransferase [Nitriliruptoraceae bacterium]